MFLLRGAKALNVPIVPAPARQLSMDISEGTVGIAGAIAKVHVSRANRGPPTLRAYIRRAFAMVSHLPRRMVSRLGLSGNFSTRIPFECSCSTPVSDRLKPSS